MQSLTTPSVTGLRCRDRFLVRRHPDCTGSRILEYSKSACQCSLGEIQPECTESPSSVISESRLGSRVRSESACGRGLRTIFHCVRRSRQRLEGTCSSYDYNRCCGHGSDTIIYESTDCAHLMYQRRVMEQEITEQYMKSARQYRENIRLEERRETGEQVNHPGS